MSFWHCYTFTSFLFGARLLLLLYLVQDLSIYSNYASYISRFPLFGKRYQLKFANDVSAETHCLVHFPSFIRFISVFSKPVTEEIKLISMAGGTEPMLTAQVPTMLNIFLTVACRLGFMFFFQIELDVILPFQGIQINPNRICNFYFD